MTTDLHTLARAVIAARDNYGWSPEVDEEINRMRAGLAVADPVRTAARAVVDAWYGNPASVLSTDAAMSKLRDAIASPPEQAEPTNLRAELSAKSDRAYCQYIEQLRRDECLGWEQKVKSKRFGEAELKAHCKAAEYLGMHRAFADARSLLAAAPSASPAEAPAGSEEFGDPRRAMTEVELQEFCIALSFEQDDYTVEVIRSVENRMLAEPLFVPAAHPQPVAPAGQTTDAVAKASEIVLRAAAALKSDSMEAMRARIWNAAIEAAALVVEPVPHVDEERTCGEVAEAIRALKAIQPAGQAAAGVQGEDRFTCRECGHGWNTIDETDRPRAECPNCGDAPAVERGVAEERESFEAWMLEDDGEPLWITKCTDGSRVYADIETENMWLAWKASAGRSTAGKEQA